MIIFIILIMNNMMFLLILTKILSECILVIINIK